MNPNAKVFFERVIQQYNCGDINYLLRNSGGLAGPLLAVTVNGIDLLGGMLYGFRCKSRYRSVRFMQEHMKMSAAVAEMLYACVRCGVAHEGTPKIRFKFGIWPKRPERGKILFKDYALQSLVLNVTELAYSYLDAVDQIAKNIKEYALNVPQASQSDEDCFQRAYESITNDVALLAKTLAHGEAPMSSSTGTWVPPSSPRVP